MLTSFFLKNLLLPSYVTYKHDVLRLDSHDNNVKYVVLKFTYQCAVVNNK